MSFTLLLLRVPPGASEDDVERIAISTTEAERTRVPGPLDPEKERRKRSLVDALRELREALEQSAFVAFERLSTLRGVRDELARSPDLFWAAHASLLLGEREEATQLLERALKNASRNPEFSGMVWEWGRRQGWLSRSPPLSSPASPEGPRV